jgi:hypothetical protein
LDLLFLAASVVIGASGVHILPFRQNVRLGLMAIYVPLMALGLIDWMFGFRGGL